VSLVDYRSPPYPPDYLPIVTFDTTTHNLMLDRGLSEEQLVVIRSRRYVRLAGLAIEEIMATPDNAKRASLFRVAAHVTADLEYSDTLMPPHELVKTLILTHYANPWTFKWWEQPVVADSYHDEIRRQSLVLDSSLSAEQRQQNEVLNRTFRKKLTGIRPNYDAVFAERGVPRPRGYRESLQDMQSRPQRFDISLAKRYYDEIAGTNLSRYRVGEFVSICEPFQAYLHAYHMGRYDLALRDPHLGERFQSGRNDLHMSVYLPYCDEFVTDEKKGEHARCMKEIVSVTGLPTNILTFDEFYDGLLQENAGRI
jgi:hypothetical protein